MLSETKMVWEKIQNVWIKLTSSFYWKPVEPSSITPQKKPKIDIVKPQNSILNYARKGINNTTSNTVEIKSEKKTELKMTDTVTMQTKLDAFFIKNNKK